MEKYKDIEKILSYTKHNKHIFLDQDYCFIVKSLQNEADSNFEYVGETIEKKAKEILKKYNFKLKYRNFYAYLMREVMRNVVEHSMSEEFMLCIYTNEDDDFGFRVIDNGIGIKKSLESNPSYSLQNHMTAISFAVKPGITRSYKRDPLRSEEWQNSGFGLYMVSNIILQMNGRFELSTGNVKFIYDKNTFDFKYISNKRSSSKGTDVICMFNTREKVDTSKLILNISKRGNEYIKQKKVRFAELATAKTASKASTLIEEE